MSGCEANLRCEQAIFSANGPAETMVNEGQFWLHFGLPCRQKRRPTTSLFMASLETATRGALYSIL